MTSRPGSVASPTVPSAGLVALAVLLASMTLSREICAQTAGVHRFCGPDARDCVDDTLEIRFAGGSNLELEPGESFEITVVANVVSDAVAGWSFGLTHDPLVLRLDPVSLTIAGTDASRARREPSFDVTTVAAPVDTDGRPGFFSAVALSLATPASLPTGRGISLARARYEVIGPIGSGGTALELSDRGLSSGGPPVAIEWTVGESARRPRRLVHGIVGDGDLTIRCGPPPDEASCPSNPGSVCTDDSLEIAFGTEDGPRCHVVEQDGESFTAVVVLDTISRPIQGWSYGVTYDPRYLTVLDLTTRGTDAEEASRAPIFEVTRWDAVGGSLGAGFVSAYVLSFITAAWLPPGERNSLAAARFAAVGELPDEGTELHFESGTIANPASPPVSISLTIDGIAAFPSILRGARVCREWTRTSRFRRGDADRDGRRTISDAVRIVGFVAGLNVDTGDALDLRMCLDALDADDNGRVDFIDAAALLRHLFQGAGVLPPPGDCGRDTTLDELRCEVEACR